MAVNPSVVEYVRKQLVLGVSSERIRKVLSEPMQELTPQDIDMAFEAAGDPAHTSLEAGSAVPPVIVPPRTPPPPPINKPFAGGKITSRIPKAVSHQLRVRSTFSFILLTVIIAAGALWMGIQQGLIPYEAFAEVGNFVTWLARGMQ